MTNPGCAPGSHERFGEQLEAANRVLAETREVYHRAKVAAAELGRRLERLDRAPDGRG